MYVHVLPGWNVRQATSKEKTINKAAYSLCVGTCGTCVCLCVTLPVLVTWYTLDNFVCCTCDGHVIYTNLKYDHSITLHTSYWWYRETRVTTVYRSSLTHTWPRTCYWMSAHLWYRQVHTPLYTHTVHRDTFCCMLLLYPWKNWKWVS